LFISLIATVCYGDIDLKTIIASYNFVNVFENVIKNVYDG